MNYVPALPLAELPEGTYRKVKVGNRWLALFHFNAKVSALGNTCLHKGGSLGEGFIKDYPEGKYVACPWHGWEYNIVTGSAPPGYHDQQAAYDVKVENGMILVAETPFIKAKKAEHATDPLADLRKLEYQTETHSLNVLGISTTNMNENLPRPSTSERGLEIALEVAKNEFKAQTKLLKLRELMFRPCEGYYSRHENACTWPCSISEMNADDGMNEVYRAMVLWADILLVATPIRWGNASSLYYKMAERLNCVQNQITLSDKVLIKNKVAAFIVTGGQDNIQQVVGQMSVFFTELGFVFPPFSFAGWSRGWIAEDMEHNVRAFNMSRYMNRSVKELVTNSVKLLKQLKQVHYEDIHTPLPKIKEAKVKMEEEMGLMEE